MRQHPLFCLVSGGNRAQAQGLPSTPLQPLGDLVANSSCTGQIEISAIGNASITGGRWQPAGGERAGQGIYLGHCCQSSQRPWEASVQGESCPVEERLGGFLLFQQSSSSSFFFIFFFFYPHLFEGFNCLTSGTSSTLHWLSRRGCAVY